MKIIRSSSASFPRIFAKVRTRGDIEDPRISKVVAGILTWVSTARGGLASYPSSVLMTAVPAKVAGVKEIILTTPARQGKISPFIIAASDIAGVDRIFKIGGAQAIAALAYGTESIPRVDKIVGPGNAFVAAAKKMVFGQE